MSHLSQIKTKIRNTQVLQKTLMDLGFNYNMKPNSKFDMLVSTKNFDTFELLWNGQEYYISADMQTWKYNMNVDLLIDQITQKYSYNSILEESIKNGFTNLSEEFMKDGSIKLIVQRWE